ncbi:MAG: hypothetical protein LBK42_00990 [Propionibacteriaceae bacterium]|nr:hypothetical protein [Propionibacteriaceae bacterium]
MSHNFARLGLYARFVGRRERLVSPVWVVCLAGLAATFAALYPGLAPTPEEMAALAATMSNPAMVAMMGPVYGPDDLTPASLMAQECLIWFMVAAAVMNIFLVNRHTRADEELGRLEMLRALPVGRLSGALATIVFAALANALVSVSTAGLLLLLDIKGTTVAGAFAYGAAIGATGLFFAGLTLLLAQLFSTAHSVSGAGFALLGLFYVLRALGDVGGNALWLASPLGWGLRVEAFHSDSASPIIASLGAAAVLSAVALAICGRRDHGAGVIPARRGRARASKWLRGPLGFAWRISRGAALGWGAGLFLLGASYGSVCGDIDSFVEGNETLLQLIGGGDALLDNYVALIFVIMSLVASVPVMLTVMRIQGEERRGRLEQIFARAVPRGRLYRAFVVVAALEGVALEGLFALGLGATAGGRLVVGELLVIGLAYLPAIWAMLGMAAGLIGLAPKLSGLVWLVFGYTFVVLYLGRTMGLPDWAARITPFGNIPQLPAQTLTVAPLIGLTLVAAALTAVGGWRFRQRDIG